MYQSLKQYGGYTDDNIILFLADEIACNARNPFKNKIYNRRFNEFRPRQSKIDKNLYTEDIEVDYVGEDVTVENFFRVLLGRHVPYTPSQQRIGGQHPSPTHFMDEHTNVFIFITGHGGEEFFKFRDTEEFLRQDLRSVLLQMQLMKRYKNILFVSDTCQAFSLAPNDRAEDDVDPENGVGDQASLRNVYSIGSSLKGQSSYAFTSELEIGHSIVDRYSHHFSIYLDKLFEEDAERRREEWREQHEYYNEDEEGEEEEELNGYYYNEADENYSNPMDHVSIKETMVDSMYTPDDSSAKGTSILGRSDVGFTDVGCDRRMYNVPLSDFFVMQKPKDDLVLLDDYDTSYDWYDSNSSSSSRNHPSDRTRIQQEQRHEKGGMECGSMSKGQCLANDTTPSGFNKLTENDDATTQSTTKTDEFISARHPSDLTFLLSVISFVAIVRLSSRIW